MPLPLLIALAVAQAGAQQSFSSPFGIAEPNRIALTPKIDGKLDLEEWDPLFKSADMQSLFEWEPRKLYVAAVVPTGHDVLASIDLHADGWLHGKDNLEIRLSNAAGGPKVTARLLDGTGINGPEWVDLPGLAMASTVVATSDGKATTFEASIGDSGFGLIPANKGTKMMIRIDDPLSTDPPAPAYLPRTLAPVTLVMSRSEALPAGLSFNPEMVGRASAAGENIRLRMAFNGTNAMKLQKLEMYTEGPSRNDTIQITVPFPPFDDKGRSYVDYSTGIMAGSPPGYRILRGNLTTTDNISAVTECSYRVGPLVDIELVQQAVPIAPLDRSMKFAFYIKSNSARTVTGDVTVVAPEPLKILNGAEKNANISTAHGTLRQAFELFLPPNVSGTFPIKFVGTANGKKYEQVQFLTVGGL
jgi:hypothetical protein